LNWFYGLFFNLFCIGKQFFRSEGTKEISQLRSGWKNRQNKLCPEGTLEN